MKSKCKGGNCWSLSCVTVQHKQIEQLIVIMLCVCVYILFIHLSIYLFIIYLFRYSEFCYYTCFTNVNRL